MATNVLSSLIGVDPTITKYFRSPEGRREKQEGLSPRSSIFTDANNELNELMQQAREEGSPFRPEDVTSFLEEKGLDVEDFKQARKEWSEARKKMETPHLKMAGELGEGGIGPTGRLIGRGVGYFGEAIEEGFPETAEAGKEALSSMMGERTRQELFFPAQTGLEEGTAYMGALLAPLGKVAKVIGLTGKLLRAPKIAKAVNIGTKTQKVAGSTIKYGGGFSIVNTALEKPEDNWVMLLSEMKGDTTIPILGKTVDETIEHLKINPEDTKSEQYLRAFINNLYLEGPLTQIGKIAQGIKWSSDKIGIGQLGKFLGRNAVKYTDKVVPIGVKEAAKGVKRFGAEWLTSRYGVSGDAIAMLIARKGANREALTQAAQMSDDLARALREEEPWRIPGIKNYTLSAEGRRVKQEFLEKTVNEALAGNPDAIRRLSKFKKTSGIVKEMRDQIDDLSRQMGDITEGELSYVINENLKTYLNRSYRIFDDPTYLRGGIKDLPDDVKEAAEKLFISEGIDPQDVPAVLRHFTEGLKKKEKDFFLKNVSTKSKTSSVLKSRREVPDEIRALWGEVKDPFANYVNTYRKLSNVLSEYKFRDEIAEEAIRMGRAATDSYKYRESAIPIGDIAEEGVEQAGRGIGALGGATTGGVKDPLANLFIDPAWKKAIDNGMEVVMDDGLGINSWMKAKGLSQAMATVYSIPTHGVNMMGNMFIMLANGTLDPKFVNQGFKDLTKRYVGSATYGRGTAEAPPKWYQAETGTWVGDQLTNLPEWTKNIKLTSDQLKSIGSPSWAKGTLDLRKLTGEQAKELPPEIREQILQLPDSIKRALNIERTVTKSMSGTKAMERMADRIGYYQRLGIIDSSIGVETLARTAKESLRPDKLNDLGGRILDANKVTRGVGELTKYTSDRFVRLYEAEDNLFKIWNFEQLKAAYKKALPNIPEEQLDKFVAERARDMMPNYNMIPKAFKSARVLPLGNFIAFPLEMIRNGKNILKYAWKDASGQTAKELGITDPKLIKELQNIGLKRAAGMTSAIVAGDAMKHQSMQIFGITSEQDAALNTSGLPPWESFQSRIYTGPIKRNKKGELNVPYMNLGQVDPQAYWKAPAKQVIAALINNRGYNEEELDRMFAGAAYNIISPYADPSMLTQTAIDLIRGKGIPEGSTLKDIALIVGKDFAETMFVPRTAEWFKKRAEYKRVRGMEEFGPGEEVTEYGYAITPGQVDIPALLGWRRKEGNLSHGMEWNLKKETTERDKVMRPFIQLLRTYALDDPDAINEAYMKGLRKQWELDNITRGKLRAYRTLGFTDEDIINALTSGGTKDNDKLLDRIIDIENNIFMPSELPENMIPYIEQVTKAPIEYQTILNIYNRFLGSPIEEEE